MSMYLSEPPKKPRAKRQITLKEQRLVNVIASGEARSISDGMIKAGFHPSSTSIRHRLTDENGDLRNILHEAMDKAGMTLPRILDKVNTKMDAKRTIIVNGEASETDDNDAQLRATEIAIKLYDRTGKLPAASEGGSSGGNITVNVLMMPEVKVTSNE